MERVPDPLCPEHAAEIAVVVQEGVVAPDREHDVHAPQVLEAGRAVQVREILDRGVEIGQIIPVTMQEVSEILHVQGQVVASREGRELME